MFKNLNGLKNWLEKATFHPETVGAVFIAVGWGLFILANFAVGFVFPLWVLASLISLVIAFVNPRSGIYAVILLTFLFERFFTLQPVIINLVEYKIYPLDVIFLAVLANFILNRLFSKEKTNEKLDAYLVGFIGLSFVVLVLSVTVLGGDFSLAFSSFKNYALYALLYFVTRFLFGKKEHLMRLFRFALAGAVGILIFILIGLVRGEGLWTEFTPLSTQGVRILAFPQAFYLSLVFIGGIAYLSYMKAAIRISHFALLAAWAIGIAGSMMRHLWGALAMALLAVFLAAPFAVQRRFVRLNVKLAGVMLLAGGLVFYASFVFPQSGVADMIGSVRYVVVQRVSSVFSAQDDESYSWRNTVWEEALKAFAKEPVTGLGFGRSIAVEKDDYQDFVELRDIHNSALALFVQTGAIPFALFAVFVLGHVRRLWRSFRKYLPSMVTGAGWLGTALWGWLIFYLVVMMFQPYLETNMLGIFFWMILAVVRVYTEGREDGESERENLTA